MPNMQPGKPKQKCSLATCKTEAAWQPYQAYALSNTRRSPKACDALSLFLSLSLFSYNSADTCKSFSLPPSANLPL